MKPCALISVVNRTLSVIAKSDVNVNVNPIDIVKTKKVKILKFWKRKIGTEIRELKRSSKFTE